MASSAYDLRGDDNRSVPGWRVPTLLTEVWHCILSVFRGIAPSRNGSASHLQPRSTESALNPSPTGLWWSAQMATAGLLSRCLWYWLIELAHILYQSPQSLSPTTYSFLNPYWRWHHGGPQLFGPSEPQVNSRGVGFRCGALTAITAHLKVISCQ